MYGIGGERRLDEFELDWLPGYEGSRPVRVGNAASGQFQLDVYGEVVGVAGVAVEELGRLDPRDWARSRGGRRAGRASLARARRRNLEARGPRRHYTQSKVMAWVVFDTAIRLAERFGVEGPVEHWKQIRQEIHDEVCEKGYDAERRTFTQILRLEGARRRHPGGSAGRLSAGSDPRVTGTINAVRDGLGHDGFISRYSTAETDDGLHGSEGQFLACSFWLVTALALDGRLDEARELFERLLGLTNDLGLLSEEYDVGRQRQVGNFPQAFSHLALINAAATITAAA